MRRVVTAVSLALVALALAALPALAHQPFFEDEDIAAASPWPIADPTVSTVVYATLDGRKDVDYFVFDGQAGQAILLEITIPQIAGQEEFAPSMALLGPGLPAAKLPAQVERGSGVGAVQIPAPQGPAESFFEPFSRTSYWERQSQRLTLPESGRYVVAIWHPAGEVGRYGFVIGDKERLGGDLLGLGTKMPSYWTAVPEPADEPASPAASSVPARSGKQRSCAVEW